MNSYIYKNITNGFTPLNCPVSVQHIPEILHLQQYCFIENSSLI